VSLGKRPSFAWRSIFSECDFLQEGLIWRIGDGKHDKICGDKWLPTLSTYLIQTLRTHLAADSKVEKLINQDKKWWKVSLIKELFMRDEAEII
jgi:hypothetical protein